MSILQTQDFQGSSDYLEVILKLSIDNNIHIVIFWGNKVIITLCALEDFWIYIHLECSDFQNTTEEKEMVLIFTESKISLERQNGTNKNWHVKEWRNLNIK